MDAVSLFFKYENRSPELTFIKANEKMREHSRGRARRIAKQFLKVRPPGLTFFNKTR